MSASADAHSRRWASFIAEDLGLACQLVTRTRIGTAAPVRIRGAQARAGRRWGSAVCERAACARSRRGRPCGQTGRSDGLRFVRGSLPSLVQPVAVNALHAVRDAPSQDGAGDGGRTHDNSVGNAVLYH